MINQFIRCGEGMELCGGSFGGDGITVNAVAPGFVETDMTRGKRSAEEWTSLERGLADRTMMRRIGRPSDIANAVASLASP
jgi:3-oxoacyl-[acyl-carrier protein] reductase